MASDLQNNVHTIKIPLMQFNTILSGYKLINSNDLCYPRYVYVIHCHFVLCHRQAFRSQNLNIFNPKRARERWTGSHPCSKVALISCSHAKQSNHGSSYLRKYVDEGASTFIIKTNDTEYLLFFYFENNA